MLRNSTSAAYTGAGVFRQVAAVRISNSSFLHTAAQKQGGCLRLLQVGQVEVRESLFEDNVLVLASDNNNGGALSVDSSQVLLIHDTRFSAARAAEGGAVFAKSIASRVELANVLIADSEAEQAGGALFVTDSHLVKIVDSVFVENRALSRGGGGAVHIQGASSVHSQNSSYRYNAAEQGEGGALYLESVETVLLQGDIYGNNTSSNSSTDGRGGGCIFLANAKSLAASDSEFSDNQATQGGCISAVGLSLSLTFERCSFLRNRATGGRGGALYLDNADLVK